jgi:hypothetical protein
MANKYSAKRNPHQFFLLPKSLDVLKVLPPDLRHKADEARYFISLLIYKAGHQDSSKTEGYSNLRAATLIEIMDNRFRRRIIQCLLDHSVIECDGIYYCGKKSLGYRLHRRFANDDIVVTRATNHRILQRLDRYYIRKSRDEKTEWLPVHHRLYEEQFKLDIVLEKAERIIESLVPNTARKRNKKNAENIAINSRLCQSAMVSVIAGKYHKQTVGTTGRVYNCITSLNKKLRPALMYNGKPLESVDIRNSQPALLAKLVRDYLEQRQRALPKDFIHYVELTSNGEFYNYIYDVTGKAIPVADIKHKFLTDIFAKKKWVKTKSGKVVLLDYYSKMEQVFQQEFSTVYDYISETNQKDLMNGITSLDSHSVLIRTLQRIESELVIHDAAVRALDHPSRPFILTLHDAIFCGAGQSELIQELMLQAARDQGYQIKTKIEPR